MPTYAQNTVGDIICRYIPRFPSLLDIFSLLHTYGPTAHLNQLIFLKVVIQMSVADFCLMTVGTPKVPPKAIFANSSRNVHKCTVLCKA
jgi:hypothetical protein